MHKSPTLQPVRLHGSRDSPSGVEGFTNVGQSRVIAINCQDISEELFILEPKTSWFLPMVRGSFGWLAFLLSLCWLSTTSFLIKELLGNETDIWWICKP